MIERNNEDFKFKKTRRFSSLDPNDPNTTYYDTMGKKIEDPQTIGEFETFKLTKDNLYEFSQAIQKELEIKAKALYKMDSDAFQSHLENESIINLPLGEFLESKDQCDRLKDQLFVLKQELIQKPRLLTFNDFKDVFHINEKESIQYELQAYYYFIVF